jgi:predicted secreted protein
MTVHRIDRASASGVTEVNAGDEVVLTVDETATTGYVWQVAAVDGPLEVLGDRSVAPSSNAPGAGGAHEVHLRAADAGNGEVHLMLRRPWERSAPASDELRLKVRVT